jgi:ATPase subunit of ABC transporter with duplicated ATPase domains
MSLVRLDGVTREVGDFVILDHVSAAIAADDRIGLVGPNGAGKTTLLRMGWSARTAPARPLLCG